MNKTGKQPQDDNTARKQRCEERTSRIRANTAKSWSEADLWDLEFWQQQSPQERLSALVALRNDLAAVHKDGSALDWND